MEPVHAAFLATPDVYMRSVDTLWGWFQMILSRNGNSWKVGQWQLPKGTHKLHVCSPGSKVAASLKLRRVQRHKTGKQVTSHFTDLQDNSLAKLSFDIHRESFAEVLQPTLMGTKNETPYKDQ